MESQVAKPEDPAVYDHQATVRRFLDAMVDRDRATLEALVHADAVWNVPPSTMPQFRGPHIGKDAIVELVAGAGASMFAPGTARVSIVVQVGNEELSAVQFRIAGTMPSGVPYDNSYAFFFRFSGAQICEIWENVDTAYVYGKMQISADWLD